MESDQGGAQFRIQRHDPAAALSLRRDVAQFQGVANRAVGIQHHGPGRQGDLLRPQSRLERQQQHDAVAERIAVMFGDVGQGGSQLFFS
jgi:hypothetical protein